MNETAVIDASRDPIASRRLDDLLREARFAIEPVTEAQARMPVRPTVISAGEAAIRPV